MRLTQISLANPAAITIVAIAMLGAWSLVRISAQLSPQIDKSVVMVVNAWPRAHLRPDCHVAFCAVVSKVR